MTRLARFEVEEADTVEILIGSVRTRPHFEGQGRSVGRHGKRADFLDALGKFLGFTSFDLNDPQVGRP